MFDINNVLNGRNVILWGTGQEAVSFLYNNRDFDVEYCVEQKHNVSDFLWLRVFEANISRMQDKYVVVAVEDDRKQVIKNALVSMGKKEFRDFVFCGLINKKLVLVHGNCHMRIVKGFLNSSLEFRRRFYIYPIPLLCNNDDKRIEGTLLDYCDVIILQDVKTDTAFGYEQSMEYLLRTVNKMARTIIFPNVYGLGIFLFPQAIDACRRTQNGYIFKNFPLENGADKNGFFPTTQTDYLINDMWIEEAGDIKETINACNDEKAIDHTFIRGCYEKQIGKLKSRERYWDITVSDYIENNYKDYRLFSDHEHPSNILIRYMTIKLLGLLGIDDTEINNIDCLDSYENPIYPCVVKALGLRYSEDDYAPQKRSTKMVLDKLSTEEYIREYVWYRIETRFRRLIDEIKSLTRLGRNRYIIAPFGKIGRYIKDLLENELHDSIEIVFCIDNNIFENEYIYRMDNAPIGPDDMVLLATLRRDVAEKLYYELLKKTYAGNIVHVFDLI